MKDRPDKPPIGQWGSQTIAPGESGNVFIEVGEGYSGSRVRIPVHVRRGPDEGPVLFVTAALHGDEINGIEIIRRVLSTKSLNRLRGTLIAVPVVNVHGFLDQSRYLPDRRDLNRSFPGSAKGSIAARMANTFVDEIVAKAEFGSAVDYYRPEREAEVLRAVLERNEGGPDNWGQVVKVTGSEAGINDEFGHQFGDKILIKVADIFVRRLGADGRRVRLGGDEFQILYCGDNLDDLIETAVKDLQQDLADAGLSSGRAITLSAGIVSTPPGELADLESLYRSADNALYAVKHDRAAASDEDGRIARTGTWKL